MIYDPKNHSFSDLRDGQLLAKKMTQETQSETVFEELYKIELEASSIVIKSISKEDTILSYYIEQRKDGNKKGITLKKQDFEKLLPILKELSE